VLAMDLAVRHTKLRFKRELRRPPSAAEAA
jgi:hypothetical protein